MPSESARHPAVAEHRPPDRVVDVEIGIDRDLVGRARPPKPRLVAIIGLVLLQDRRVAETERADLQRRLPHRGFEWDQPRGRDFELDLVDVRQLSPVGVDPMIVWVAHQHVALRILLVRVYPGLEDRQFRVVELVQIVLQVVK